MALRIYRVRVWLFLASILIPAAIYGILGIELYRQQQGPKLRFAFYTVGIVFALAVTLFSRYVVWQDYRRSARSARLRSEFVARVSHELRTPLTSIQMLAETLSLGRIPEPERQREYLDRIILETGRLARLVENVLEFSRAETGGGEVLARARFSKTELRPIVESTIDALRPALESGGFKITFDCGESLPTLTADADALRQALTNLLANALKYSGDSRSIEIRLSGTGNEARIEVADWGIGVPGEYRSRIFEKFFRAPRRQGDPVPGVGLGLALVAEIMRAHGGTVEVRDNQPQGSVFTLVLPVTAP